MRIFVISLPTQTERRDLVRSEFKKANMEFSFFDGIDTKKKQIEYFRSFDVGRFHLNTGRHPLANEIACYASHTFDTPVDRFIKDFWVHGQPLYQLTPHIVDEGEVGLRTTTIGARHKPRRRRMSSHIK